MEKSAAVVRVYTGHGRSKLLNRPVQQLYPIEVNENESKTQEGTEELQLPSADTEHEKTAVVDTSEREAVKVEVT